MRVRMLKGLVLLAVVMAPLGVVAVFSQLPVIFLILVVFGAPALAAYTLAGESGPAYFSVLALQIAVLAWWLGGARGLWSALKRSLVAAALIYLPAAGLVILIILEAGAGLGGPGW